MEKNSDNNFLKEIRDRFHDMEFMGKKKYGQPDETILVM
jgi:hypothetical protein